MGVRGDGRESVPGRRARGKEGEGGPKPTRAVLMADASAGSAGAMRS
jgi:hypothetical protein